MNPTVIGLIVFACTLGGALAGIQLRTWLPEHHVSDDSRDTVKLGIGLVATMTALVLGLVTASAKSSFETLDSTVKHAAADLLAFDRTLARYGPEAAELREELKHAVAVKIEMIWPSDLARAAQVDPSATTAMVETLMERIAALTPHNESQRRLQARALDFGEALLGARWIVVAGAGTSVPLPFLVILVFWLTITFTCFGLLAPRNPTVIGVLVVCAFCVGSAVFLILEMDRPFDGLIRVSVEPLHYAYARLNR